MSNFTTKINDKIQGFGYQRKLRKSLRNIEPIEIIDEPDPPNIGNHILGQKLLDASYLEDAGIEIPEDGSLWDAVIPRPYYTNHLNNFEWMDDLYAVKTISANRLLQSLTHEWLAKFGRGNGKPWLLKHASWRLIRLIAYFDLITTDAKISEVERVKESICVHTNLIEILSKDAHEGFEAIVAHTALLYAALAIDIYEETIDDVLGDLDLAMGSMYDHDQIDLPSRNPEELSQIFCLLSCTAKILEEFDHKVSGLHKRTLNLCGQMLRALRFGDRALLPAHGGGYGNVSEVERALSQSKIQGTIQDQNVLGFTRIRATTINGFLDTSDPPSYNDMSGMHASTLGIWIAERNQILFGSGGASLGQSVHTILKKQESDAHSTLVLGGQSSSQLEMRAQNANQPQSGAFIAKRAKISNYSYFEDTDKINISATHNGYLSDFGLNITRKLSFDRDGVYFRGVDILESPNRKAAKKTKSILDNASRNGLPIAIYFHLGPGIEPVVNRDDNSISFTSASGSTWIMRQDGGVFEIDDSQYFNPDSFEPVPTKSVIIRSRLIDGSGYLVWSLQSFPK